MVRTTLVAVGAVLGFAWSSVPAHAASELVAQGKDPAGDVRITGPRKSGPSGQMRRTIDLRHASVRQVRGQRVLRVKVRRVPRGDFGGLDQVFVFQAFSASGEPAAVAYFTHRKKVRGSAYSDVTQTSCTIRTIRRSHVANSVAASIPARCFPVPSGGYVKVESLVGTFATDDWVYAKDSVTIDVSPHW